MTILVPLIGRLGNLLFIYCHARKWCELNGCEFSSQPWIGEKIFEIPDAVRPGRHKPDLVWPEKTYQDQDSLIYTRKEVREWLRFRPEILEKLSPIKAPRVLFDLREASDCPVRVSHRSYTTAAKAFGHFPDAIESDLTPTRLPCFTGDASAAGLGTTAVSLPAFCRIMIAGIHFRANSTFSWWAATLGNAKVYAPIIKGKPGGLRDCEFVEGNWPIMSDNPPNTDLHLREF